MKSTPITSSPFTSPSVPSNQPSSDHKMKHSWWKSRSTLELFLMFSSAFFLALWILTIVAMIVSDRVVQKGSSSSAVLAGKMLPSKSRVSESLVKPHVCLSAGCVKAASHIIDTIDTMVEPCDDFYKFACGGWQDTIHINDDQTGITQFGALRDDLNRKLRALVEKPGSPSDPVYDQMMRLIYNQCMNTSLIDGYDADPLIQDIIELGGYPVVEGDKWNSESFDWVDLTVNLRKMGYNFNLLLSIFVGADYKNSTKNLPQIDQGSLGLPNRKYLLKGFEDPVVQAYYGAMVDMALALGANNKTRVEKEMMDTIKFEMKLANISVPMEQRRNFTRLYNKMNFTEVKKLGSTIKWRTLIDGIFTEDDIPDSQDFIVKTPSYITTIDEILQRTDNRILANYMMGRVVSSAMSQMGRKWRRFTEKLERALSGKTSERPRWDMCMKRLFGSFGVPMAALYVKSHFDESSLEKAEDMVKYIMNDFIQMLKTVEWMDPKTRKRAIEKARAITTKIGYSPEILDFNQVMSIFKGLKLDSNATYYRNVQLLRKHWQTYEMKKLQETNSKSDWRKFAQAATINAFYNSMENSIKFPAGILQGIFFDKDRPNYLNYGGIGFIIGHEIVHGFDDRGRQFDKDGNNRNWWDHEADKKFRDKAQCIVNQYSSFSVPEDKDLKLNGINTQGENIADNGGLKQAFLGYQTYVKENGPEPKLPGLDYTPNQLFWISAANIWCSKIRPQSLKLRIQTGVHSPPRFRVIGPIVNSHEFAKTFNCPVGSEMNPIKKCSVW